MELPFTAEQFFEVFSRYNLDVWPMQIVLNLLAFGAVGLLCRSRRADSTVISGVLAFLWAWMAVAYHFLYFSAINPASWLFGALFLVGAAAFARAGIFGNRLRFRLTGGVRGSGGWVLIGYALVVYPLLGRFIGHRFPAAPTFGLPCPTTIFTLGMLCFAAAPLPRAVFAVPLLWAAIGSFAAFQLGVLEDLGLLAAGFLGLLAAIVAPRPDKSGAHRAGTPLGDRASPA